VPEASDDAAALFKQFVMYNAEKRLSAEAALLQPYFYTPPMAAKLEDMPTLSHSGNLQVDFYV
jgi:hypothetical protein